MNTLLTLRSFMPPISKFTLIFSFTTFSPSSKSSLSVLVDLLLIDLRRYILSSRVFSWLLIRLSTIFLLLSARFSDFSMILAISCLVLTIAWSRFLSTISFLRDSCPSLPLSMDSTQGLERKDWILFL